MVDLRTLPFPYQALKYPRATDLDIKPHLLTPNYSPDDTYPFTAPGRLGSTSRDLHPLSNH